MIANIFAIIELFLIIYTRFATEEYEQEGSAQWMCVGCPVDSWTDQEEICVASSR